MRAKQFIYWQEFSFASPKNNANLLNKLYIQGDGTTLNPDLLQSKLSFQLPLLAILTGRYANFSFKDFV